MKVLIDSRMLYMSGIGRYIRNILPEMAKMDDSLSFDLLGNPNEFKSFMHEAELDHLQFHRHVYTPAIYSMREQWAGSLRMLKGRVNNIVHIPHYNAPWLLPEHSVATVHDLIHFKFPRLYSPLRLKAARQVLHNTVQKAARIIVVSEATAADLIDMFPGSNVKEKTIRTYLGVSERFKPMEAVDIERFKCRHRLGEYILYVGNRLPHKNLGRLVQAVALLRDDLPDLQLVVAGNRLRRFDELDKNITALGLGSVIEWGPADDSDLVALYNGARAFILPSLYEGFGLPVLEAMSCGTPVVVAQAGSLPEVAGEAGTYFDPYNIEDIARGVYQVVSDQARSNYLKDLGLQRASLFSWAVTARQTLSVYRAVADR